MVEEGEVEGKGGGRGGGGGGGRGGNRGGDVSDSTRKQALVFDEKVKKEIDAMRTTSKQGDTAEWGRAERDTVRHIVDFVTIQ